jgi:hypothetical protein
MRFSIRLPMFKNSQCTHPKVSKSLNVDTLSVKPSLTDGKVVTCVSHDHCSLLASQNAPIHAETLINSDSDENLAGFRRNWASFFFPFFFKFFYLRTVVAPRRGVETSDEAQFKKSVDEQFEALNLNKDWVL